MEQIISQVLLTWGPFGIILIAAAWVLYNQLKVDWEVKKKINNRQENSGDLKDNIFQQIDTSLDALSDKVDLVNEKIEMVNTRVSDMNDRFDERYDALEDRINSQSKQFIKDIERREQEKKEEHNKQMNDLLILGPRVHKTLAEYIYKIKADHLFIGSFHNGSNSLSGIPYYKFDIIAERFFQVEHGINKELAPLYKDVDILRHNKLPSLLIQNKQLYFGEDSIKKLYDWDNILYQKFIERNISQFAINILTDKKGQPSGFVGCIKYDNKEKFDLNQFKLCADTLESIYHINEN